jgi:hypothetical protein
VTRPSRSSAQPLSRLNLVKGYRDAQPVNRAFANAE